MQVAVKPQVASFRLKTLVHVDPTSTFSPEHQTSRAQYQTAQHPNPQRLDALYQWQLSSVPQARPIEVLNLRWFDQWLLFKLYTLTALDRSHLSFLPLNLSDDSMVYKNNGTSQSRRRRKRAQRDAERSMRDHDLARADARSRKSVEQTFALSDWEESIAECKNLSPACRENPLWDLGGAEFSNQQAAAADGRISPDHRSVD
ncbi:hypothetical protein B0H16DRAFT_1694791 [Mycena metata]|uniref:Uncharacterized protein n=1 Tax=Mycena metata TaxID=1033252 RepID=A0AAD7IAI2_9AGAR|nr:hypothetical protein B0H16DRAFT_1694791 [Mycena metata]